MKTVFAQITALPYWFIIICVLGCFETKAQTDGWDLKQCIQYGLENHKTNEIYQGNIKKANYLMRENVALYFPQIYGDFRTENYFKLPTQILSDVSGFNLDIPGFPDISLAPSDIAFKVGKKFMTTGSIDAEQMLFNRRLLVSFRGLRPNTAVANLNFQQNQENLIYNISQAYIQVHVLQQQLTLLGENKNKFTRQLEILKLQVEKGVAKKMDANRVNVALNNITSQLDVATGGYEVAVNRLKNAMGMNLNDSLAISDSTEITSLNASPDASFDVNRKVEMQLQQNQLKLLDVQKKRIGAEYFPTLSLFARYSAQSFDDEIGSLWGNWYDFSSVGLKLSVPIFDGLQKSAQRKQQIINQRNAQLNMELSEQGFQLQYQNAVAQLQRARANMANNNENLSLAQEVFNSVALAHQQGATTLSELLNAETAYKESQLNYVTAMLNYYTAIVELEKAKGTLTEFYQKL